MLTTEILLFGMLLAGGNVLGGAALTNAYLHRRITPVVLHYFIALGAGFMLAAVFIDILPEAVAMWAERFGERASTSAKAISGAMLLVLGGYLLIHLFEHIIAPHFHFGAENHREAFVRSSAVWTTLGGLSMHTFFDGISIAAGFLVNFKFGLLIFIAILLHKIPEGFTAASIALAGGFARRTAFLATIGIGVATLLGVISVIMLHKEIEMLVMYALPFSAGVTLYVAASDLVPEINRRDRNNTPSSALVFVGVVLFYVLHLLLKV